MATLMLGGGVDIRFIQAMLGHADNLDDADLHARGDQET
jgi:integrase